jgi:hypothetical protein
LSGTEQLGALVVRCRLLGSCFLLSSDCNTSDGVLCVVILPSAKPDGSKLFVQSILQTAAVSDKVAVIAQITIAVLCCQF